MGRTGEDTVALIGIILGIFSSLFSIFIGDFEYGSGSINLYSIVGYTGIFSAIVGMYGYIRAKRAHKEAGILMILSAIGMFICCRSMIPFYLFSTLALLIGGFYNIFGKKA
ncbi:hypothetical protein [Bacillus pseudomycoides]|uniref:hypothetical protein n=1 Tax=Bacillus pseudomycoides TaxID=64104 RepID=UPI000BF7CDA4|nr:hypothetical protein [Bacillus pseudomycoides]PEP82120.1 hypothetical protein CN584_18750 [Bacillus pseudomycoides]PGF07744.1 hypothetical protein COM59_17440 [Bacillus pseudomycoides]